MLLVMLLPYMKHLSCACALQILKLRKEERSIRRRKDERQEKRAATIRQRLERLLETNTHDAHAVKQLLDEALQQP